MHGVLEGPRYDLGYGNPAAVNELDFANWNVYPNPTQGTITVRSDIEIDQIRVMDISGKEVLTKTLQGSQTTLELSYLGSGVYLIEVVSDARKSLKRLVIQ